jgi:hypothetical protein
MTGISVRALGIAAIAMLACFPTEPCACPPSTALFTRFGSVHDADGQPVAGASIVGTSWRGTACGTGPADLLVADPIRSNASGAFRGHLRSLFEPGFRCLRLVAFVTEPGVSDSASIPDVTVYFRIDREPSDSLGVLVQLP